MRVMYVWSGCHYQLSICSSYAHHVCLVRVSLSAFDLFFLCASCMFGQGVIISFRSVLPMRVMYVWSGCHYQLSICSSYARHVCLVRVSLSAFDLFFLCASCMFGQGVIISFRSVLPMRVMYVWSGCHYQLSICSSYARHVCLVRVSLSAFDLFFLCASCMFGQGVIISFRSVLPMRVMYVWSGCHYQLSICSSYARHVCLVRVSLSAFDLFFLCASCMFGQGVIISFRSVLLMRVMYDYTVENFLIFNRLLQTVPSQYNCYYIDWFRNFLDYNGDDINLLFYSDSIHLNRRGISYLNELFFELIRNRHLGRFSAFKF